MNGSSFPWRITRRGFFFYVGPRNDDFLKNFASDLGSLRAELLDSRYSVGDFEFSPPRHRHRL